MSSATLPQTAASSPPPGRATRLRVTSERAIRAGWPVVLALYLALMPFFFRPQVSIIDPVGYYSWARSILIDGNLDVANEFQHYGIYHVAPLTPTGYFHNQWAAGCALFWLPPMAVAHGAVLAARALGATLPADGYSWPYYCAAALTSTACALAALLISHRIARRYVAPAPALLATVAIWLATPLIYYGYQQPLMSHATTALLSALFLWAWLRTRDAARPTWWRVALGAIVGLAVWVRTEDGVLLGLLCLEVAISFLSRLRSVKLSAALRSALAEGLPILVGFALLFLPMMLLRHTVYGGWVLNTYTGSGGGHTSVRGLRALDVLFSSNRGLFVWMPIAIPALCGLPSLWRRDRRLVALLVGWLLLVWAVLSVWSGWSGGDSFGPRHWVRFTPLWILGLAALLQRARDARPHLWPALCAAVALLILWTLLLMAQYMVGLVASSGRVDLVALVRNQFRVLPAALQGLRARLGFAALP